MQRLAGESTVDLMNRMGYAASAFSNHEWDFGLEAVADRIAEASFPFLAANILDAQSGEVWARVEMSVDANLQRGREGVGGKLTEGRRPRTSRCGTMVMVAAIGRPRSPVGRVDDPAGEGLGRLVAK